MYLSCLWTISIGKTYVLYLKVNASAVSYTVFCFFGLQIMVSYRKCNMKSNIFVQWCIRKQLVGANGYKEWTGKKGLTEEGGSQINFDVKLKTLSCIREEAEQHREQLEPAAGFGESCGVGHGHEELGRGEIVLAERGLGSEKSFQHLWLSPMSCQEFLFLFIPSPLKLVPLHQNSWGLKAFRLLPKNFVKVSSDAMPSNVYVLTERGQEL